PTPARAGTTVWDACPLASWRAFCLQLLWIGEPRPAAQPWEKVFRLAALRCAIRACDHAGRVVRLGQAQVALGRDCFLLLQQTGPVQEIVVHVLVHVNHAKGARRGALGTADAAVA